MQSLSTPEPTDYASLSRRRFLAGAVAIPATIGAPAAIEAAQIGDNYDELMMLLDQREDLVARNVTAIRVLDRIFVRKDKPPLIPRVSLWEFFGKQHTERYYPHCSGQILTLDPERVSFHDFFEEQIEMAANRAKLKPEWADWPVVKARDYARVTSELHRQLERRQRWEQESGYLVAEADVERSLDDLCALEHRIYSLPVLSFRDMRLKLDLVLNESARRLSNWHLDADNLRMIFASFGDFAGIDGRPDLRQDRAAEAGAA